MNIDSFHQSKEHPFGMLRGYKHANEKESVLAWALRQCIDAGAWMALGMSHEHPTMVKDGLLERKGPRLYSLTEKSKGLLYAYYHRS